MRACINVLTPIMFFSHNFAPVTCGHCDFRYDIDSKSPDLAKHVSKELFYFSVYEEFNFTFNPNISLNCH